MEPAVDQILDQLQEMADESPDNNIDSFLKKFVVHDEYGTVEVQYPKKGHECKKPQNREYINSMLDDMEHIDW